MVTTEMVRLIDILHVYLFIHHHLSSNVFVNRCHTKINQKSTFIKNINHTTIKFNEFTTRSSKNQNQPQQAQQPFGHHQHRRPIHRHNRITTDRIRHHRSERELIGRHVIQQVHGVFLNRAQLHFDGFATVHDPRTSLGGLILPVFAV